MNEQQVEHLSSRSPDPINARSPGFPTRRKEINRSITVSVCVKSVEFYIGSSVDTNSAFQEFSTNHQVKNLQYKDLPQLLRSNSALTHTKGNTQKVTHVNEKHPEIPKNGAGTKKDLLDSGICEFAFSTVSNEWNNYCFLDFLWRSK